MKYLLSVAILSAVCFSTFSQNSISNSICDCHDKLITSNLGDKADFQFTHERCFKDAYTKMISFSAQDSSDAYYASLIEELKNNCDSYNRSVEIMDKMTLQKSTIKVKDKKSCKKVMRVGDFEDRSGTERVVMSMQDSIQIMTFGKPGLYTKSKVVWTDACSYKVIFIESTNPFENAVLKKGEEREIRILEIKKNDEIIFEVGMYDRWFLGSVTKVK